MTSCIRFHPRAYHDPYRKNDGPKPARTASIAAKTRDVAGVTAHIPPLGCMEQHRPRRLVIVETVNQLDPGPDRILVETVQPIAVPPRSLRPIRRIGFHDIDIACRNRFIVQVVPDIPHLILVVGQYDGFLIIPDHNKSKCSSIPTNAITKSTTISNVPNARVTQDKNHWAPHSSPTESFRFSNKTSR